VIRLTLPSAPRTKKTSNRTFEVGKRCPSCKRGKWTAVHPSEAWERWRDHLAPLVKAALPTSWKPIDYKVNCAALYYRERDIGDSAGFNTGLADLLEAVGIVANDRFITQWDGSRLLKDSARPRVELVLTKVED
jgi:hypothetical protein